MRTAVALVALPLLAVLAACGSEGPAGPAADGAVVAEPDLELEVTVDVFSGRPNPSWTVDGDQAIELADLVADLPESGTSDGAGDLGLGFRGFLVRGLEVDGYDVVRVRGTDIVLSNGDDVGPTRTDEDGSLYTMLRELSAPHLEPAVLDVIPNEPQKGT